MWKHDLNRQVVFKKGRKLERRMVCQKTFWENCFAFWASPIAERCQKMLRIYEHLSRSLLGTTLQFGNGLEDELLVPHPPCRSVHSPSPPSFFSHCPFPHFPKRDSRSIFKRSRMKDLMWSLLLFTTKVAWIQPQTPGSWIYRLTIDSFGMTKLVQCCKHICVESCTVETQKNLIDSGELLM